MNLLTRGASAAAVGALVVLGMGVPTSFASVKHVDFSSSSTTATTVISGSSSSTSSVKTTVKLTSDDVIQDAAKLFPKIFQKLGRPQANLVPNPSGRTVYQLNWPSTNPGYNAGPHLSQEFAYITVDANTGQVISFQHSSSGWSGIQPATESDSTARLSAYNWLKNLAPGKASQLVMEPSSGKTDSGFTYQFVRKVNGVIAPFDHATIHLNNSGDLVNYQFSWHHATFPAIPTKVISSSEALSTYKKDLHLQLRYQQRYQRNGAGKLQLVYTPKASTVPTLFPTALPRLDAVTGQQVGADGKPLPGGTSEQPQVVDPSGPSQWPTVRKTLFTQSEVEQQVEKLFGLSGANWSLNNSQDATGNDSLFAGHQMYQLNFTNQKSGDDVSVQVDATDGVVVNYFRNSPYGGPVGPTSGKPLSHTQLVAKADAFVKEAFPNLTGAIERIPQPKGFANGNSPEVSVQYDFMVHGVQANGFSVNLNKTTGDVLNFNLMLDPTATFPSPSGAISEQTALQTFLKAQPPVLQYTLPETQSQVPGRGSQIHYGSQAELIYATNNMPGQSSVLNALTGKWVSYPLYGRNTTPTNLPQNASPEQKAVALLQENGIITSKEAQAKVTDPISREEFVVWLERAYSFNISGSPAPQFADVSKADPYASELSTALMQGWLPNVGKLHPIEHLTRLAAANWIVDWLGWSGAASHTSFFKLPYSDTSAVPSTDAGAVTMVSDAGIIPLINGEFHPTDSMTIGDAAIALQAAVETYISSPH